jgi:subtilisin family serine protease
MQNKSMNYFMRKNILFLTLFITSITFVHAQSKMNFSLAEKVQGSQKNYTQAIDVLIKGDVTTIENLVKSAGGTFKYSSGDIAAVTLSIEKIALLLSNKAIVRIEAFPPKIHLLNDTMLLNNNILPVHSGKSPLTQAYDGNGVVIGFIDSGIDITHPDFKDSLGKSRIKFLWDQTKAVAVNTPIAPYNYGQEWNNLQIDSGLAAGHTDATQHGHGTHVAGVAAGNGLATGTYKGAAPKADIIMVALDFDGTSPIIPTYPIADATAYIYEKAAAMGKPCVINASLGSSLGSHDGQDLQAQLISNLINQQSGRAFVAAAGNSGNSEFHLGYTVTSDTNFTMFTYNAGNGAAHLQLYADTADFKNVRFAIGADQMSPVHSFKGRTSFSDISGLIGIMAADTLYNNGNRIGIIQKYGDLNGGTYSIDFNILPDSTTYNWRLITTGTGKFDAWSFDLVSLPLPSSATMKDSIYYKLPDLNKTMESGFQCLDNVITVANYTNRKSYKEYDGSAYFNASAVPGKRVSSSGIGPTRDGRIKPDIAAPGDLTIAAVESTWKAALIAANTTSGMAFGGYHIRSGGTSQACPGVAGIAALYFQKNPTATAMEVKSAITSCARQDQYTGSSLPNNYWGYGKADALGALTNCVSAVTFYDKAMDQQVVFIYPNPSATGSLINVDATNLKPGDKAELKIYNALGELLKTMVINTSTLQWNNLLSPGIYFCNLVLNGTTVTTEKMVVL